MAKILATEKFTKKSDTAISSEGWLVNGGATVNTRAGSDKVVGTNKGGVTGIAIVNGSTLDTGAGNDVVTGTGGFIGIDIDGTSILDTGAGNDVVTGTGGLYGIVIEVNSLLDTGAGNDVVTGTGGAYGILIANGSALDTGTGNDVVTGMGGAYGIVILDGNTLDTGDGNDVVDALQDGFGGNGTVRLGAGKDILKGFQKDTVFGIGNFFGGSGRDQILLGEGTYVISGSTITNGSSVTMNVSEFECIGGTKGNLFNFADGTLTVGANGFATFA